MCASSVPWKRPSGVDVLVPHLIELRPVFLPERLPLVRDGEALPGCGSVGLSQLASVAHLAQVPDVRPDGVGHEAALVPAAHDLCVVAQLRQEFFRQAKEHALVSDGRFAGSTFHDKDLLRDSYRKYEPEYELASMKMRLCRASGP